MPNITFKQLEAVHQVARSGTVVKAAQTLHVTPAALTSRIKLLEEDLGLALFDRTGNRLAPPTPAAKPSPLPRALIASSPTSVTLSKP